MQQSLMPDLHIRIIGSRWMDIGHSAYFSQWKEGYSYRLYNPNLFMTNGVNGVTVTPSILWLQLPLSKLGFCTIKTFWWYAMEIMLFATLFLTCKIPSTFLKQAATVLTATLFFLYSRNWWLHLYNGQLYIAFAMIFSVSAYMVMRRKKRFFTLISFTISAVLRPFFFIALLPWFVNFNRKRRVTFFASFMITIGLMAVSAPLKGWIDYKKAMTEYSKDITGTNTKAITPDSRHHNAPVEECIEVTSTFHQFNGGNLLSVQHYLNKASIKIDNSLVYAGLLLLVVFALLMIARPYLIFPANENLLLLSFLFYILAEVFTPALRNPYNMVQYLGILGVFINKANVKTASLMLVGLCLNHDLPFRFDYQREMGELLMLVAIYLTIFTRNTATSVSPK